MQKQAKQSGLDSGLSYKYVQFELLMYFTEKKWTAENRSSKSISHGILVSASIIQTSLMITQVFELKKEWTWWTDHLGRASEKFIFIQVLPANRRLGRGGNDGSPGDH